MTESDPIDITGIDRAELLAALWNGTRAVGMGILGELEAQRAYPELKTGMTAAFLRKVFGDKIEGDLELDYVAGRPIKVWIVGNNLDRPDLYDRDAGRGACALIVAALRAKP